VAGTKKWTAHDGLLYAIIIACVIDWCARAAMVHKAPLKIYARGVVSYFYFSRAPKIWQINSAILKVPDGAWIR
jgi:hypothetical protein